MSVQNFHTKRHMTVLTLCAMGCALTVAFVLTSIVVSGSDAVKSYIAYAKEDTHLFNDKRFTISFRYPSSLTVDRITDYDGFIMSVTIGTNYGTDDYLARTTNSSASLVQVSESKYMLPEESTAEKYFAKSLSYKEEVLVEGYKLVSDKTVVDGHPAIIITKSEQPEPGQSDSIGVEDDYYIWTESRTYHVSINILDVNSSDMKYRHQIIDSIRINK